jgi:uncharacterized FlaG/YvyC family protein
MEISAIGASAVLAGESSAATRSPEAREAQKLVQAVQKINQAQTFGYHSELVYLRDQQTGRPLVRIIDKTTKEVLTQIPPEHVLRMAEDLKLRA